MGLSESTMSFKKRTAVLSKLAKGPSKFELFALSIGRIKFPFPFTLLLALFSSSSITLDNHCTVFFGCYWSNENRLMIPKEETNLLLIILELLKSLRLIHHLFVELNNLMGPTMMWKTN